MYLVERVIQVLSLQKEKKNIEFSNPQIVYKKNTIELGFLPNKNRVIAYRTV